MHDPFAVDCADRSIAVRGSGDVGGLEGGVGGTEDSLVAVSVNWEQGTEGVRGVGDLPG